MIRTLGCLPALIRPPFRCSTVPLQARARNGTTTATLRVIYPATNLGPGRATQHAPVDVVPGRRLRSRLPARIQFTAAAQDAPRVAPQLAYVEPLRLAVRVGVVTVAPGIALAVAHAGPVRRRVHRARELRRVDEALHHQQRMTILPLPVVAQPPQHGAHHPGGEIRKHPALGQHHEPGVVGNQMQAPVHLLAAPSDPEVPWAALEGGRLPARQRQPSTVPFRYVAQPATGKSLEAQVVMAVHQRVPLDPLVRSNQPYHHLVQHKIRWSGLRQRLHEQFLQVHGRTLSTHSRNIQPRLAWDNPGGRVRTPEAAGIRTR